MVRFFNKADFTVLRGMKPGALPLDPAPCGGPIFFLWFSVLFPPYGIPVRLPPRLARARHFVPRYDEISSQIKLAHRVRSRPNHAL